jgi:hypothetical protein
MGDDAGPMDEAFMGRLSEAICDVSDSPTACEKQLEGVMRMLREAPERSGPPPPHSDDYQR